MPPKVLPNLKFEPFDVNDDAQFEQLRAERILCGWDYTPQHISKWRDMMRRKVKQLFWIQMIDDESVDGIKYRTVGHISLDSEASPPDPDLAREDRSVMTIATFYVMVWLSSS